MVKRGLLVLLVGLTGLLSSCGSKATPAASGDGGEVKVSQDPVELVFYYPFPQDWDEEKFMSTFGDPIHQKYPNITVKYIGGGGVDKLIAGGQKVDILFTSIGATPGQLMDNGLQYDISPLIKKYNANLDRFAPTLIDMQKTLADGAIYGLPVYVPPSVIYYNKDIFDKFGVPYPKDGMTWDDLYEMSKKLTRKDGDTQYLGFGSSYGHLATMNQLSLPLVDTASRKAMLNSDDGWKLWVENLVRFYKIPGYDLKSNQMSEPNERNRFFKDRIIAMFLAITALQDKKDMTDLNWDFASFPVMKERPGVGPQAYPIYFYVTTMSDHKDQAFQAVSYLTSDEFQLSQSKAGHFLTVLKDPKIRQSFGQDDPFYKNKNVKALLPDQYAPPGSVNKYNSVASGEMNSAIIRINLGEKDINTALREAEENANKKIEAAESGK